MTKDNIKDLWDLAQYINELDEWDRDIEEICEAKGWKYYDNNPWYIASHNGWDVVFMDDGSADVVKVEDKWKTYDLVLDEELMRERGYNEEDED